VRAGNMLPNCGIPTIDTDDVLHLNTEKPFLLQVQHKTLTFDDLMKNFPHDIPTVDAGH
jgi:hypothetical protein